MATILGVTGGTLIWSAIYFSWTFSDLMHGTAAPSETNAEFVPVPAVGFIALYYLIGFGMVPALSIMFAAGCTGLLLAYVLVRRFR